MHTSLPLIKPMASLPPRPLAGTRKGGNSFFPTMSLRLRQVVGGSLKDILNYRLLSLFFFFSLALPKPLRVASALRYPVDSYCQYAKSSL